MTGLLPELANEYRPADVVSRVSGLGALTGVQALGKLLVDQHRADQARGWKTAGLVSGYRGSPLAGLDLVLDRNAALLAEHDIEFIPGVNEELGATVVYGSQLAPQLPGSRFEGVFGLWYGKAPGVDRSVDAFKHGTWMGTTPKGGVLVVAGDDPASKSSSLPSNSTMALAESYMPVLAPVDVADVLRLGRFGFEMSRFSGAWTAFTVVTAIGDAYEVVDLSAVPEIAVPEFEWNGRPWKPTFKAGVGIPEALALEREVLEGRLAAAVAFGAANGLNRVEGAVRDARLGIIASGHTYACLRDALGRMGLTEGELERRGVRLLRLGMVHPLDQELLGRFADGLDEVVVVEDKRAFIETLVKEALFDRAVRPRVYGKRGPDGKALIPVTGALEADRLVTVLGPLLAERLGREHVRLPQRSTRSQIALTVVNRTPFFCSGCPHNRSTEIPDGSLAGAGIGCHALTTFMDRSVGFTQMGGEGVSWVGAARFTDTPHFFQNLGDGTFFHSGSLAVRQAIAAGTNITFKLLYNAAVAMTGGQHADGSVDPVAVTRMLHAEGVAKTVVVTDNPRKYPRGTSWAPGVKVRHRDDLDEVQQELRDTPGVTVVLYDQECAAEKRRKRKRGLAPDPVTRVHINESVCEGCGDCGRKSNCLSVEPVETEFGRKTQIDQTSCNKDYSCLLGDCPSFMTVVPGEGKKKPASKTDLPADLPEPASRPSSAALVMVGIGGTGVVTANQVLATAALISGLDARALDQTGLSQKAGAVVSHLRISPVRDELPGLVPAGAADGYLVFDPLAATTEPNLSRCAPERTVAVVSTAQVPTGRMVVDHTVAFPGDLVPKIAAKTKDLRAFDALELAERLFGGTAAANFLVIGAAYQLGVLPLTAEAIEKAIEINGVGVATTTQAFRAGRKAVLDPSWLDGSTTAEVPSSPLAEGFTGELRRLLDVRLPELVAYQDEAYAQRYLGVVRRVADAERAAGLPTTLSEAVARNLFKLMAYKDEYEVARLHLAAQAEVEAKFGAGTQVGFALHPPVLRAMGMRRKITLKRTARPAFGVLRAMRRLRGTAVDPFGHAHLRKVERELVAEYVSLVPRLVSAVDQYELAVEIASLPDVVRGYEEIKLANVEIYRERLADLVSRLGGTGSTWTGTVSTARPTVS
ncbi:indolepyruvate ferredoxin oxidoreductase family protein [Actinokineospora globicatena]|uniref:indolepyruvate ferredoxin oxidoreductase family protein n=1 Tax=Actinokineospora globicatena TaxID=103729 RepID=UPI0020A42FA0|nr:indolepyruvate ferredoxin oxidoreductase family protein [Actinokineospora globicatena]MCP2301559.1 indolepyruvate ferredoxin oxidoreductase [Actinokineospora globicatena]GLW76790.1 indolepyruvate ferredoxin oxidoreductase [Actinokineospora globicatena]GLW83623.1 indolepyruvate ferredoxin oxidoreductase [Actinokineospora globicatena]